MSRKVEVNFEVRDMLIIKDTLKQMGINFDEISQDQVSIGRSYHNITIDAKTGNISYDEANTGEVNKIKQTYMVNFYKDRAIREGMQIKEEVQTNGEIVLNIIR
jgi:hypothetical protein